MKEEVAVEKEELTPKSGDSFDIAIIGSGPAGMSAALCARRAQLSVLIIDSAIPGGQTSTAYKISNYLGFPKGILGVDLARRMEDQLKDYGVYYTCETAENIINIKDKEKVIQTDLGAHYRAKAVIFALGLEPKKLGSNFEKNFLGRGISYYAQGDAESYRGQDVAVIGGGNCALYAADYLAQFVNKLYIIHRSDQVKAVKMLQERIFNNTKIDVLWNTEVVDVFGIDKVEKMKLFNSVTQQHTWLDIKCIFIYSGRIPPEKILSVEIDVDEKGYIITDECMRTNIPGIYAAGDIRSKQIRQVATAVSDGMIASINIERDIFRK